MIIGILEEHTASWWELAISGDKYDMLEKWGIWVMEDRSNDHLEPGMGKRRRDWADKCKPVCPEKDNNSQTQEFLKRPFVRTIKK